ncbi:MAG: hypothetical protein RBT61_01330 [Candidatus Kapabacteria bacterium]|nr:hypothetical protein [Candidatus Kapabacteria bacterium]
MKADKYCKNKSCETPLSLCSIIQYLIVFVLFLMFMASCSTIERKDDAVRIKIGLENQYTSRKTKDDILVKRDGTTLRGTVFRIIQETTPNSCPIVDTTTFSSKYSVIFLDSDAGTMTEAERIPLNNIELVGQKTEMIERLGMNRYGNINWFENFNDPLDPRSVREVPVDSFFVNTCPDAFDCNCNPLSMALELNCPDCEYENYFTEIRGGYAVYDDRNSNGVLTGREAYLAEIVHGYRSGQWGIGISLSTGVPVYNSKVEGEDILRPLIMLHGRKQFDKFLCMYPFVYGQLGFAIDEQTRRLFSAGFCGDCTDDNVDCFALPRASLPLSFGFGVGMDIPLPFCIFDVSVDLAYKSIVIGETYNTILYNNVSDSRRINMLVFRIGVTLGY